MANTKCGHKLSNQGEPFGPTSPCQLDAGHAEYHEDDKGLPFGPWQGQA